MTDPIADMLTRIRNAVTARHARVEMPASKLKAEIARILQDEGYIAGFKMVETPAERAGKAARQSMRMFLKYGPGGEKAISGIERVSRPGRRVYANRDEVPIGARRARRDDPDDVARRDDRPRRPEGRRRRRDSLQRLVRNVEVMSRIGKKPIAIPKGVTVKADASGVDVKGPKGQMKQALPPGIVAAVEDGTLVTKKSSDDAELNKFHGLARSLVNNAVLGVTEGWKKELDIVGVGYRAEMKGQQIHLALGYSHPVVFDIPKGIDVAIEKQTHITVTGVDRQLVGQVAANLRRLREPDPYQQKGVRYTGEVLKKKAGKTGA